MPNQRKYRTEYWQFLTPKGIEKKMICVLAGDNERARMLKKAKDMARNYGWKMR